MEPLKVVLKPHMKESSSQPRLLTSEQSEHAVRVLMHSEITLFSCLFWRMDKREVVRSNRTSPDDFVYLPVKGALDFQIGKCRHRIDSGAFVMIPAGVSHGARMTEDTDYLEAYALHLHAVDDKHRSVFASLTSPVGKLQAPANWFRRLGLCAHLMGTSRDAGGTYGGELLRDLLVEQVMHGTGLRGMPEQMDARISNAVGTIRRCFDEEVRVEELARHASLSAGRFRQLFKDSVGASPKQYLQQVRLAHARALLQAEPSLTVQEIALQSGFRHPHNFHTLYRRTYGETPKRTQRTEADGD